MKLHIQAIWGIHTRNLKILSRQKQLVVAPVLLPIILMFLTAVIMGAGGDQWPVGLIDESYNAESQTLVKSIKSSHSNITPYYNVVETKLEKARESVREGRLQLLIRIPKDYDQSRTVYIETFNINSDMMKNVRLRLEHSILDELKQSQKLQIIPNLITDKPKDIWRVSYIAGSCLLLSLFLGAVIIAANLFAFERENRTKKEILLTPLPLWSAGIGNIITAVIAATVCSIPSLLLAFFAFKMEFHVLNLLMIYGMMIPVMMFCASIGLFIAYLLKNYRVLQPVIIVTSIATFFGTGGFAGVSVLPEGAQIFSKYWIFSRIFEWFNPVLHGFTDRFTAWQVTIILLVTLLGILLIPVTYKLTARKQLSGGQ
ncbi:ABC transporter permease [Paenibacillus sp. NPDC055715]